MSGFSSNHLFKLCMLVGRDWWMIVLFLNYFIGIIHPVWLMSQKATNWAVSWNSDNCFIEEASPTTNSNLYIFFPLCHLLSLLLWTLLELCRNDITSLSFQSRRCNFRQNTLGKEEDQNRRNHGQNGHCHQLIPGYWIGYIHRHSQSQRQCVFHTSNDQHIGKSFQRQMNWNIPAEKSAGLLSGMIIRTKISNELQPSILADSSTPLGIPLINWTNMKIKKE